MMKKLILIFLFLFLVAPSSTLAVSATPSASPTATQETVEDNVQERLRNIIQEKLSTTEAQLREKIGQLSLVGFVGKFTAISSESLTFQSNGDTLQVKTTDKTTYNKNGVVKLSSIAIGDKAIVIGTNSLKDIIDAKRIVVVKDTPSVIPAVISGKIVSSDAKTRTVNIRQQNVDKSLTLSRKANLKIEALVQGKSIIAIYSMQGENPVITTVKVF